MDANEPIREQTLSEVAEGEGWVKLRGTNYRIGADVVHVRYVSPSAVKTGTLWPFNLNPTSLAADYELWICGCPGDYYLIPKAIVESMHADPAAYTDHSNPGYAVPSVDLVTDVIIYGRERKLSAATFRGVTLRELREKRPVDGWQAADLLVQASGPRGGAPATQQSVVDIRRIRFLSLDSPAAGRSRVKKGGV